MTESEINELRGLPLRAAVATHVFGYEVMETANGIKRMDGKREYVPHYESDANAMMQVVAETRKQAKAKGIELYVRTFICDDFSTCQIHDADHTIFVEGRAEPDKVIEAVDRAALLCVAAQGK